ncbi:MULTISPECIES: cell division ATP-binding protein FtsE [Desulfosediminicola]|uniref:cell division ATP-binding protein FtsE n=1 Tax=Desulfosediminicola TaxID=2886823 RepID=UPI001E4CE470|nr:cell division ATP-binding protein FtsE [Desulfosediminicola ganghwensis]
MTNSAKSQDIPMVELIKVFKRYPPDVAALTNISLSIGRGEKFFIIGRSGAGKTTLLKLVSSMEPPSNGLIEVSGKSIHKIRGAKLARLRQKIGVAYQDFKLLLDRTAAENIAISMEVSYKKPQIIRNRVRSLLEQLDLSDKHNTITAELSRGEQQRVALARAVANSPTMVLVDEPTGNLDADTTERVVKLLNNSHKSGATVIIATHDESIYTDSSSRIMELRGGMIHSLTGGTAV